jgi:DNA-binding transcriptional MerR regulator
MYTIKEIADLGGVTTRTLRYYDQLGLVPPARIGENGYRYYDHGSLLRLQQILFFRELDVPLKQIKKNLNKPDFDPLQALKEHQLALNDQLRRLNRLLETLEMTIKNLQGESDMTEKQYFEGFDETRYEDEVRELWGDTPMYEQSRQKWSSYSASKREEIKAEGESIFRRLVTENPDAKPDDQAVQEAVRDYYIYLNRNFYSCEVEFLRDLAEMWVQDSRFAVNFERIREGGAVFARKAVQIYCDNQVP